MSFSPRASRQTKLRLPQNCVLAQGFSQNRALLASELRSHSRLLAKQSLGCIKIGVSPRASRQTKPWLLQNSVLAQGFSQTRALAASEVRYCPGLLAKQSLSCFRSAFWPRASRQTKPWLPQNCILAQGFLQNIAPAASELRSRRRFIGNAKLLAASLQCLSARALFAAVWLP